MMTDEQTHRALDAQNAVRTADTRADTAREQQARTFRELHQEGVNDRQIAAVVALHHTQVRNIRLGRRSSASRRKGVEPAQDLLGQLLLSLDKAEGR